MEDVRSTSAHSRRDVAWPYILRMDRGRSVLDHAFGDSGAGDSQRCGHLRQRRFNRRVLHAVLRRAWGLEEVRGRGARPYLEVVEKCPRLLTAAHAYAR